MSLLSSVWNKIVMSSQDPTKVSLTVKGILTMAVLPTLLFAAKLFGVHLPDADILPVIDAITHATETVLTAVGAVTAVYGAVRKVYNLYFKKPPLM